MHWLQTAIDVLLHVDVYLAQITADYGLWTYAILALIVFCETGLVVTPFLPGDSLLFAAGAITALGTLDPVVLSILLILAAILGDAVNYAIGRRIGERLLEGRLGRFIRREHIERTHAFYERHGGKTIIIARFMPIVRTFAPFVAGIGAMAYRRFFIYNVAGAVLWVVTFVALGAIFGNTPAVKKNFSLVILGIIVVSILPGVIEFLRSRRRRA